MTLISESLLEQIMEDPWGGDDLLPPEVREALALQREQVRLRLVAEYSSNPLYQARAAKDPDYWNTFYLGQVR